MGYRSDRCTDMIRTKTRKTIRQGGNKMVAFFIFTGVALTAEVAILVLSR